MKKRNSKDNLEDLFRNLFNDSQKIHEPEGWNMPSEDDWDSIQKGLSKEKKEEKKFLYWDWIAIAASVLFLLSVFQLYQSNQKIERLSDKIIENDKTVQKIQSDLLALNKQQEIKPADSNSEPLHNPTYNHKGLNLSTVSNKEDDLKEKTVFNNVNAAKNSLISKFVNQTSSNKKLEGAILKTDINLVAIDNKDHRSHKKELNVSLQPKEKRLNTFSILDKLPTSIAQLESKDRSINWTKSTITPIIKKRPKWYVAASYATVLTTVKDKGPKLDKNEFFPRQETQKTAYSTGLQFGIKLDKGWSIETGLHLFSIKKSMQHNRIIPYDFLQERLNNNGEYESKVNFELGSSEGAVDTDISLVRSSSSTVSSDAKINMDIVFSSARNYLDLPLIVKKDWAIGSFALSLKAGLLNRFLLSKNLELQQIIIDDDTQFNSRSSNFRERTSSSSKNNYSAHYLVGTGLEYTFIEGLSFYIEPTFIRSIQPVISPRGASIFTKNKMLNVGLRYEL